MRIILIKKASDLQTLAAKLEKAKPGTASSSLLERVRKLNPHVDFARPRAGTVLLVPEEADVELDLSGHDALAEDAFEELLQHTKKGFRAAAERVDLAADELSSERKDVAAAAKTAGVKRLIASDRLLEEQMKAAGTASNEERKRLEEAGKQVEVLRKLAVGELEAIGELLRSTRSGPGPTKK